MCQTVQGSGQSGGRDKFTNAGGEAYTYALKCIPAYRSEYICSEATAQVTKRIPDGLPAYNVRI